MLNKNACFENIVNIKKISDKHDLSLICPFNFNLLICKLWSFLPCAVFRGVHI